MPSAKSPRLIIASSELEARRLASGLKRAVYLPASDDEPFAAEGIAPTVFAARNAAITAIDEGNADTLVTSPAGAMLRVGTKERVKEAMHAAVGDAFAPAGLKARLAELGYNEQPRAFAPGTFAVGGATVDAWSPLEDRPVRLRFEGEVIAVIEAVDAATLRSEGNKRETIEFPRAALDPNDWDGWYDRTVFECLSEAKVLMDQETLATIGALVAEIDAEEQDRRERDLPIAARGAWLRHDDLENVKRDGPLPTVKKADSIDAAGASTTDALIGERLMLGDLVVHLHHGLGRFDGLVDDPVDGGEMLTVAFADGTLQVPAVEADLVWRYGPDVGEDGAQIAKMGSADWTERLATMNATIAEAATGFQTRLNEHAKREAPQLDWSAGELDALAKGWHPLTADQTRALDDIRGDTTRDGKKRVRPPMDRLLCGDTGYGKTEVLLRTAVAAVVAGLQVAVIAPTHVLATQHYASFSSRLDMLSVRVSLLTGTTDDDDEKAIVAALADGEPMIVVGTHRLAGEDIVLGKPGLLVVDEEQRFGAEVKNAVRDKMPDAHVLATTATPIPRTTAAAVVGLRAISTLRRPPSERRPVRTTAEEWNADTLKRAVLAEHRAGGRTFIVVSRIADMEKVESALHDLVPSLEIARVHGRMDDDAIDRAVSSFREGECDILLATTMIETGIDVPSANLMVILDAGRLGLAQLHQLRGRVGRGDRRGRTILFTACDWIDAPEDEGARERIDLLVRHSGIGAGFDIAADDLAQRGAGDLFGDEQRGHLADVGLELFGYLFRDVVSGEGRAGRELGTARVSTGGARIPMDYVPNETVRARLYGRIAKALDADELEGIIEEIKDRFGPIPAPLQQLAADAALTLRLRADGVREIDVGPKGVAAMFDADKADELRKRIDTDGITWKGDRIVIKGDDIGVADLLDEIGTTK